MQKTSQAGKLPPRPGRPGGRPGGDQVDMGVGPRVDLGVDLPGRARSAWVHLDRFLGCFGEPVTNSDGSDLF